MKKSISILSIVLSLLLVFGSCSKLDEVKNPLDGFKLIIDYDIFNTFFSFRFMDGGTGELIGSTDETSVTITVTGEDKDGVVNQLGERSSEFYSFSGLLTLALNPKDPYIPTFENPIKFTIVANYDGYFSRELQVSISEEGKFTYDVYLEKEEQQEAIRKYYRTFETNENGEVKEPVSIVAQGGGEQILIPSGTVLLDSLGQKIENETVYVLVHIFENFSKAAVPQSLIVNVNEEVTQDKVFDIASLAKIELWTDSKAVKSFTGGNISFQMALKNNAINPVTEKKFVGGEMLKSWSWQQDNAFWNHEEEIEIIANESEKLFFQAEVNTLGYFCGATAQNVCHYSGDAVFNLDEDFIQKPVEASILCTRQFDGRLIDQVAYNLVNDVGVRKFDFLVPEYNSIQLKIANRDYTNSFESSPNQLLVNNSCATGQQLNYELVPTSMEFSATIGFQFTEEFPEEQYKVNIGFFDLELGKHLLSIQEDIFDGKNIEISTSMQQASSLRIVTTAIDGINTFYSNPNELIVNDVQAENQRYQLSLTPENCLLEGNINFNFQGQFAEGDVDFAAEIRDETTNEILEIIYMKCSETQSIVPLSVVLPKNKNVYLKIRRVKNETKFHARPYEFSVGSICQRGLNWNVEISPVQMISVDVNVRAVCPDTEIIPTLTGYYRLVWDDEWDEVELVYGQTTVELELNGTYEMGIIVDEELVSETYIITGNSLNLEFELDQNQCDKFGY